MAKDNDKFFDTGKKGPTLKYCYSNSLHGWKDGLVCTKDDRELKSFCDQHNYSEREQPKQKKVKVKKGDMVQVHDLDKITPSFWFNGFCYYASHKTLDHVLNKYKHLFAKVGNDKPRHPCYFKPIIIKQEEPKKVTKKRMREVHKESKLEHQARLEKSHKKITKALSNSANSIKNLKARRSK